MKMVWRSLRRDLGAHFAYARNLKEPMGVRLRRAVLSVMYLLYGFYIAFRGMFREQIGSRVRYRGKTYFISNWSGSGFPTLAAEGEYLQHIPRAEIQNIRTPSEIAHRFGATFSWWMSSWHAIYVNRKLGY